MRRSIQALRAFRAPRPQLRQGRAVFATLGLLLWLAPACNRSPDAPTAAPTSPPSVAAPSPSAKPAAEPPHDEARSATAAAQQEREVARGAALYAQMCAVCHAEHGEGYKADQATALNQQDFLASVSNDFLGFAIAHGRKGTTMSAWLQDRGGPLSEADIHALIARLRVWQKQPSVTLDERPVQGDADHGKQLFNQHCAQCHGPKTGYVRILARQFLSTATDGYLRHAIRVGRSPTPMLAYDKVLGDQGIEDVIAYMRTFPSTPELPAPDAPAPPLPLGKIPLNPSGPEPQQFQAFPAFTSVEVVHKAYARKARIGILDARAPTDYADKHIAGAVSVPFYDPSPYLQQLPKNAWLVAYCGCPHAESGALAAKLMDAGFKKVTVLDEGLLVWSDRGYPTRSGTEP